MPTRCERELLEGWGARLVHRTTRRIGLTDSGQAVLSSCRQLLELAEDVQHLAGNRNMVQRFGGEAAPWDRNLPPC